ncbi:MAG: hypothetical protein OXI80_08355 [Caldilineaceae bacterium]|nr:hypothetical protein [Caldilineaceae bacterium]
MRTIESLHEAAKRQGIPSVLEISTKSSSKLGESLSAFELSLTTPQGVTMSVESAYQGSKVFEDGGPFHDLYEVSSREAKRDPRLRNSGEVTAFEFCGQEFAIEPQTAFYNWLYMTALSQREPPVLQELKRFKGFSDIAFNPKRSINCQARAVAVYVALNSSVPNMLQTLDDWDAYLETMTGPKKSSSDERPRHQLNLPFEDVPGTHPPP